MGGDISAKGAEEVTRNNVYVSITRAAYGLLQKYDRLA